MLGRWFKRLHILLLLALTVNVAAAAELSLEDFFRHAEFGDAAISPTGQYLAVSVPEEGNRNLAILDISDPQSMAVTAAFSLRGGESPVGVTWVSDERLVFQTTIQQGVLEEPRLTGRVYGINADGGNRRQLFGQVDGGIIFRQMSIIDYLPDEPDWILIQHWAHDRLKPYAERLNVNNGRTQRGVGRSPLDRGGLLADHNHEVRFAYGQNDDMEPEFAWRPTVDSEWQRFSNDFSSSIRPLAFNSDGNSVYFSSRESGKLGIYEVNLETGEYAPVVSHERVELDSGPMVPLSGVKWSKDGSELLAARFMDGKPQWHVLNEEAQEVQWLRSLEGTFGNHYVHIHNWTRDGKYAMVSVRSDVAPAEYFLLNTEGPELRFIAAAQSWIDPQALSPMQPISFTARDGKELDGYLTLPKDAPEGEPVPMVVYVHGGPHGPRDRWGYDNWVQMFAYHGFGVLQINFRGSGGYGREFEEAGYQKWGAEMQDDITDGTLWAMEQGYADKERTCIAGGSYGGFATLSGITREPDLYACAWAFVGVFDLPLLKEEGNVPGSEAGRRYLDRVLGTDEDILIERSPTTHVANIRTPLFISHGAEDRQAHVGQYHLLKERLDEAEISYEEMLVEGEGHGFYRVENNVQMMERVLQFMKAHTQADDIN